MAMLSEGNNVTYQQYHYVGRHIKQETEAKLPAQGAPQCDEVQNMSDSKPLCSQQNMSVEKHGAEQGGYNEGDSHPKDAPVIDIVINNVVCSFNVRCHLNLRQIALTAANVEFRREHGMLTMKLRNPNTTASIWSSGKITCTGATSEDSARKAARRFARILQKMGFRIRFANYRVVNVLGTCTMPFGIKLNPFSQEHRNIASYEPELHPGVTYKIKDPKATLKIFSTGSITITAPSVSNVQAAVEHIFPLVYEFQKEKTVDEVEMHSNLSLQKARTKKAKVFNVREESDISDEELSDSRESDNSWD